MNMWLLARTMISYFFAGILILFIGVPCFLIALLPARYRLNNPIFYFFLNIFYWGILKLSFMPLAVTGKIKREPAIIVANHQSSLDIPLIGALCNGFSHVWLVLEKYAHKPFLGFFVRRMFIPVDQTNSIKAARSLIDIMRAVDKKQRHLIIFPEGGRFNDGTIHPFFEGFAIVAQKINRPVVPVFIKNNGKIFPPFSFYIYSYPIVARIGEPMYMADGETAQEFSQRIYNWFVEQNKQA